MRISEEYIDNWAYGYQNLGTIAVVWHWVDTFQIYMRSTDNIYFFSVTKLSVYGSPASRELPIADCYKDTRAVFSSGNTLYFVGHINFKALYAKQI